MQKFISHFARSCGLRLNGEFVRTQLGASGMQFTEKMQGRKFNIAKSQFLKIRLFDHFWANFNYDNSKNREIQPLGLDLAQK